MKNLFLKKMIPIFVFALGILGAFGTMSMQSAEELAPKIGWATNNLGQPCALQVQCSDSGGPMCRVSYPSGHIAYDKVGNTCVNALFRP
ncbi:DUF6520 family protein [Flavobacterium sp.]|jgi:hypothetical protein|uniref:DUF6520 family protein n=1 Tax=Flavobacterium sp. TaxID=239 RepID=UPI002B4ACFA3|nr:DUF6520 family protein [Flavobacterium sp.]HLF51271.1 DUF6520 family protein [Flavobacterium sp.]